MVSVLRLLIEHSYLGREMHQMAAGKEMPESVKRMLAELGLSMPGLAGHPGATHQPGARVPSRA